MTVRELIAHLQQFDPDLPVCYSCYSEYALLEAKDLATFDLGRARADGWVPGPRSDKEKVTYLILP